MIDPAASAANLRRLAAAGARGRVRILRRDRLHRARRRRRRRRHAAHARPAAGVVVRTYMAHHAGMTLVALANALLGDRMVERFHADPRVQATELLLQERVPRHVGDDRAAAARRDARRRAGRRRCRCGATARRTRVPAHAVPVERQLRHLGDQRRRRRAASGAACAVTRWRRDATRDADGQFIYLRDVRSGAVWSATYQPTRREPDDYAVDVLAPSGRRSAAATTRSRPSSTSRCRPKTTSRCGGSRCVNHGDAHPRDRRHQLRRDRARARRPTISRIRRSASCSSKPSTWPTAPRCSAIAGRAIRAIRRAWAFHVLEPRRPAAGAARMGNRSRALPRPRPRHRRSGRRSTAAPLSGTTGIVLDPIVSLRQRIRLPPGAIGAPLLRHRHRLGSRDGRGAGAEVPRPERRRAHLRARVDPRAERAAPSRHLGRRGACCSSGWRRGCSAPTARCARPPTTIAANELGQPGLWPHGDLRRSADPARARRRRRRRGAGAQVLQAQEYWRLKGLQRRRRHPQRASGQLPRRDARAAHRPARQRAVAHVEAPARRRLPAARRSDGPGRAHAARGGRAARCCAATAATCARSSTRRMPVQPARRRRSRRRRRVAPATRPATQRSRLPPMTLTNGLGGFTDDGRTYAIVLEGDQETPMPWVERDRQPALRHHRHRVGCGAHLVGATAARTG